MKKAYTVVMVANEGEITPLRLYATPIRDRHWVDESFGFRLLSFDSETSAKDFARDLAAANPGKRYDVVVSTSSYRVTHPVTETTKFD